MRRMSGINFKAKVSTAGALTIVRLPKDASAQLPSRGQVMVAGTINGTPFRMPLEPDGDWSHWFAVDKDMLRAIHVAVGDTVELTIEPTKEWIEPEVPDDLRKAVAASPVASALWQQITPMARWEWVRWTRSTNSAETRKRRVEVACSKMEAGERRPCCWNRNSCSDPSVSKSGVLLPR